MSMADTRYTHSRSSRLMCMWNGICRCFSTFSCSLLRSCCLCRPNNKQCLSHKRRTVRNYYRDSDVAYRRQFKYNQKKYLLYCLTFRGLSLASLCFSSQNRLGYIKKKTFQLWEVPCFERFSTKRSDHSF